MHQFNPPHLYAQCTNPPLEFDKQTALGVKSTFPQQIEFPEFSENLAKAVCAQVNTSVIAHVPLLDDYSCPMCMELKWRPVKLRCGHVFCIRCLIVMQTNKQHKCPLCRQLTVVDANAGKWWPFPVRC
jgi:E3 ubiquitin-protein ligase BAH